MNHHFYIDISLFPYYVYKIYHLRVVVKVVFIDFCSINFSYYVDLIAFED